jgi:hypothetical protein
LNPISPVAISYLIVEDTSQFGVVCSLGEGNETTRFYQSDCWLSGMAPRCARAAAGDADLDL